MENIGQKKITREEIIDAETGLIEFIRASDVSALSEVLHDDLLFLAPNGRTITKQMDLASHHAGEMVVEKIDATFEEINVTGELAISVVVYETKGSMLGTPVEGQFRYIRVWKRFGDKLKVVAGSCCELG